MSRRALFAAVATLSSCTCGGGGLTVDEFPARAAATICTKMYGCCTGAEVKDNSTYGPDQATCEANVKKSLDHATLVKSGSSKNRLVYHGDKAADCLTEYQALTCEQLKANATTTVPSCDAYLEPKVAVGSACGSDDECIGSTCAGEGIGVDGVCQSFVTENGGCGDGGVCGKTLYCDVGSKTCKPPKADGAMCNANFECSTGGCNGREDGGTGTCGQKGGAGTTCYATNGCSAAPAGSALVALMAFALGRRRRPS